MNITIEKELAFNDKKVVVLKMINNNGLELFLTNYGATIMSVLVPQDIGKKTDITVGHENIESYLKGHNDPEIYYFGCTVGRYANRIADGSFEIDNKKYQLSKNRGTFHHHGGYVGLNKFIWDYEINVEKNKVIFYTTSKNLDEGYPGNLNIEIEISLSNTNEIKLNYTATTDEPTPVNLTNHMYFNLNGGKENIFNHVVELKSNYILETNSNIIPTGKLLAVKNTPFDVNTPQVLGNSEQMQKEGFDHSFVIDKSIGANNCIAKVSGVNNIAIEVYTTEPSLQFYTAYWFDGTFVGKNNTRYEKFYGLCLEAQQFPDAPNQKDFPNTILYPNDEYKQETIYKILF